MSTAGTVQFNGDVSAKLGFKSGDKQCCVLAPTRFDIFFALLLKHAFKSSTDGVYLHSRSEQAASSDLDIESSGWREQVTDASTNMANFSRLSTKHAIPFTSSRVYCPIWLDNWIQLANQIHNSFQAGQILFGWQGIF